MISGDSRASSLSFRSCRSCHCSGGTRPCAATMELLELFANAEERVMAVWARIGLADVDKESKWASFVQGRLCPFLFDYVRIQESEEMAIAAENDGLFHELFFASLRLKELPRSKMLAQLVEAVMAQEAVTHTHGTAGGHLLNEGAEDIDMSVTLPSFVSVVTTLASKGAECVRHTCYSSEEHLHINEAGNEESPSVSRADCLQLKDPASVALWQLARSMTHQELHRNLKGEVERMNAIADARLQQLCFLYKQRALLQLPPHQQIVLRRKYTQKLLSGGLLKTWQETRQQSLTPSVANSNGNNTTCDRDNTTLGPSSGRATTCRSCPSVSKGEFDLLPDAFCEGPHVDHDHQQLSIENGSKNSLVVPWPQDAEAAGRGTIFEVDLGDVTRFGRRQDLSLDRIAAETQKIYLEIVAQNTRMVSQANEELQCIEELWSLFEECAEDEGCGTDSKEGQNEKGEGCVGESGDGVPSRLEFMRCLEQMQQEYEQSGRTPELHGFFSSDGTLLLSQGSVSVNSMGSYNNLNSSFQQVTRSSKQCGLQHSLSVGSESGNGDDTASTGGIMGRTAQLPAPLMKIFAVRSYAPIFSYILTVREDLQRCLIRRHVQTVQNITHKLTEMYRSYFEKTRDKAYAVAPDYSHWLQEHTEAVARRELYHHRVDHSVDVGAASDSNNKNNGLWQEFLGDFTLRSSNDNLRERIADVQYVVSRAKAEVQVLHQRLQILSELEPLLYSRSDILEQQRVMQEGSRERLLSKKVNMAKQLLFEENMRRQIARTLPGIYEKMEELLRKWNETMASGGCGGDNTNCANRRLILHGVDIADAVRQFHEENVRRRCRSSRSAPPSSQISSSFLTPQLTPRSANSVSFAKQHELQQDEVHCHDHHHQHQQQQQQQYRSRVGLTLSPPPRVTSAKTHAAKRGPIPSNRASPVPVKRVLVLAGRSGATPVLRNLPGGKSKLLSPFSKSLIDK